MSNIPNLLEQFLSASNVRVIGIDPGETTGVCFFTGSKMIDASQLATGLMPYAAVDVRKYIRQMYDLNSTDCGDVDATPSPLHIVMEAYRVYSWKAKDHSWAGLHTPRLIGAIELMCHDNGLELTQQTAQQGKGFVTDDKLKAWGLWQEGQRHARDAIRHAVHHLLFKVAKIHEPSRG